MCMIADKYQLHTRAIAELVMHCHCTDIALECNKLVMHSTLVQLVGVC